MLRRKRVNERICCCGQKDAYFKICLFSATKQVRVGPSLQSRNSLFTSAACCTHFSVELDLKIREIPFTPRLPFGKALRISKNIRGPKYIECVKGKQTLRNAGGKGGGIIQTER